MKKWYIYQKERFYTFRYMLLIALLVVGGIFYSDALFNLTTGAVNYGLAFVSTFIWFVLIRIFHEHKDFDENMRVRPYLPVQRGVVSLKELKFAAAFLMMVQLAISVYIHWMVGAVAIGGYLWLAFMTKDYGIPVLLKRYPIAYVLSQLTIVLFVALHITAFSWGGNRTPNPSLVYFVLFTYFNGAAIIVGRKMKAPAEEREGLFTYSNELGLENASYLLMSVAFGATTAFLFAGMTMGMDFYSIGAMVGATLAFFVGCTLLIRSGWKKLERPFKWLTGVWIVVSYGILLGSILWAQLFASI